MRRTPGIGPFLGFNNRLPASRLATTVETGDMNYLNRAENVDITNAGTIKRRPGFTRVLHGGYSSLFAVGDTMYAKKDDSIVRLTRMADLTLYEEVIQPAINPLAPVSFTETPNGDVIWSNGEEIGRIHRGTNFSDWIWPEVPRWQPTVTVLPDGGLPAGLYQIMITQREAGGEQSPPSEILQVEVPDNSALQIENRDLLMVAVDIYVSPPNGDICYKVGTTTYGNTTFILHLPADGGERCFTENLKIIPPGTSLAFTGGRLYSAKEKTLHFSEPYSHGLYNPVANYLLFESDITVLAPCGNGLYIVADKTYWFEVGEDGTRIREVLPYGAPAGNAAPMPDSIAVSWWSDRGLVIGEPGGQAKCVTEKNLECRRVEGAVTMIRERQGLRQSVSVVQQPAGVRAGVRAIFEFELGEQNGNT